MTPFSILHSSVETRPEERLHIFLNVLPETFVPETLSA